MDLGAWAAERYRIGGTDDEPSDDAANGQPDAARAATTNARSEPADGPRAGTGFPDKPAQRACASRASSSSTGSAAGKSGATSTGSACQASACPSRLCGSPSQSVTLQKNSRT